MARRPVHPGEILAHELEAVGLSSAELARTLDVPANRISQIIVGKRSVTADTALRRDRGQRRVPAPPHKMNGQILLIRLGSLTTQPREL